MARAGAQRQISDARQQATIALMDAAEGLLYEVTLHETENNSASYRGSE